MKDSPLVAKSFLFALDIVNLCKELRYRQKEFVLSHQLLKSGTSIGANTEEANGAISKADFRNKISIAYKESRESIYWIKLLYGSKYITEECYEDLSKKCIELRKMLSSTLITIQEHSK